MDLTDQQWTIIESLFEEKRRPDGRGRPWRENCWRRTSKSDHRCVAARLLHKVSRRTARALYFLHILPANWEYSEELPDLDSNQD
jgi:hypothetical protein